MSTSYMIRSSNKSWKSFAVFSLVVGLICLFPTFISSINLVNGLSDFVVEIQDNAMGMMKMIFFIFSPVVLPILISSFIFGIIAIKKTGKKEVKRIGISGTVFCAISMVLSIITFLLLIIYDTHIGMW